MPVTRLILIAALLSGLLSTSCGSKAEHAEPPPIGNLDDPKPGTTISKSANTLLVRGWALSDSGITVVAVSVDGKHLLDAQTNVLRKDVQKVFPLYKAADYAGWTAVLPLASFALGSNTIQVEAKAGNGSVLNLSTRVEVQP